MVKIIIKIMAVLAVTIILSSHHFAFALSQVTASIDKNPVRSNESVLLTVIADDSVDGNALDTSPLTNDFVVARSEVSSQTSVINFKASRTTQWQIVLIPKKTGQLIIPALHIDKSYTQAIAVAVLDKSNTATTKQQDVFITSELSKNDIYVQQLITLSVKLHIGVQLQRGSLTEPTLEGANIVQVGKDQESDEIVNGKRYRLIERTYAITPEKSGDLTLVSPMFSGDMMVQSRRRSGFLSFGETKPINVLGDKLQIKVRPIPNNYPDNTAWLPSELLSLHQEWQPEPNQFKVGEPITRTITLTAAGLDKSQLPKIKVSAPKGLKIYPDQAQVHANLSKDRLVSQKVQNFALVASHAGTYILPKITIDWWNTVTNKHQQAILPEQKITVLPNADAPAQVLPQVPAPAISTTPTLTENVNTAKPQKTVVIEKSSNLQWLFLTLWLITLILWLVHVIYLKRHKNMTKNPHTLNKKNQPYLALMAACKQNNAQQVLMLISPWVNQIASNITINSLPEAINWLDNTELTHAVEEIQQSLYGKDSQTTPWQGEKLLHIIQSINAKSAKVSEESTMSLNPS